MRVIRYTDKDFAAKLAQVAAASSLFDPAIEQRTRVILDDVALRGDAAVLELTERFDGAKLSADQLSVTKEELLAASLKADESLRQSVTEAEGNIAAFAKISLRKDWWSENSHGAVVGEKFDAFLRTGRRFSFIIGHPWLLKPGLRVAVGSQTAADITLAVMGNLIDSSTPGAAGRVMRFADNALRIADPLLRRTRAKA
jgi:hypothetical protein